MKDGAIFLFYSNTLIWWSSILASESKREWRGSMGSFINKARRSFTLACIMQGRLLCLLSFQSYMWLDRHGRYQDIHRCKHTTETDPSLMVLGYIQRVEYQSNLMLPCSIRPTYLPARSALFDHDVKIWASKRARLHVKMVSVLACWCTPPLVVCWCN